MVGPITFTILDASLSRGVRYGITTAFGMWCSDLMYILLCYLGAQQLREFLQSPKASHWIGIIGGIILIIIGVVIWLSRRKAEEIQDTKHKILYYTGHWFRGFMVNTFAPFSLFFWPTVTLTIVIPGALSHSHAAGFYIGVMLSIVAGDILKSVFAAWISHKIAPGTVIQLRTGLAALFVAVGMFSLGKVAWEVFQ